MQNELCPIGGLALQLLWWTLGFSQVTLMVNFEIFFREGPHDGSAGGGGGGFPGGPRTDDPTDRFRGPPSVSPSPSVADDEPAGDGGGRTTSAMALQPTEPMEDHEHEQVPLLPTPAGSVMGLWKNQRVNNFLHMHFHLFYFNHLHNLK